ncbi:MFS general substrate transporter [Phlegmacium glaucopus]|nr:MFS general substrate transporter [Phlegmacium glaucopus]
MESSEETPLLPPRNLDHDHNEVYKRFTPARKRGILAIVSFTGLIPLFVSGTFIPSIPQIAKDLDSTGPIVGLAVSVSILATSLGTLFGASYSTFYGRKPVYLTALPLLFLGSLGVASSRTIPQLMSWRFIQAIGASPGLAVGTGVIGDIYRLEERGQAMGIFFAAVLLGPALAPLLAVKFILISFWFCFAAHYYSWRLLQQFLGLVGLFVFFLIMFFLPETYHPGERGVDKLDPSQLPKWRPVILNPLRPLWLLRSPNLLAVVLLLVPLAYTIGVRYNIKNEALIGACFLPAGVGNMIGAPLAGRLSDRIVVYYRKKRGGEWYPEDRLRATLPGALILVPLSVLISGLLTEYVPGTLGLVLNLICLFINGVGVDIVTSPSAAYFVDLVHSRSAEAIVANNTFCSLLISIAFSGILPMIGTYGLVVTNTASALLAWLGFGLLWFTIEYGERLRAVVDVGFSTADNN